MMKKIPIHWPTLWQFCLQETWLIPLAGSFCSALMFGSAAVNFALTGSIVAVSTLVCLALTLLSVAAFVITVRLLGNVYYVALLDEIGVVVDAHIIDKLYGGETVKGLSPQQENALLSKHAEVSPDLHQLVYKYRYKNAMHIKKQALIHDELFSALAISQRIEIKILADRPDIVRVNESVLLKQYRESMMSQWTEPKDDYASLAQFKNGV